jgi:glycosyltransferase involved in cell wall biosynthesis
MVGDSPLIMTGFGRVQRVALEAFLTKGWECASVTALQHEEKELPAGLGLRQYVPIEGDALGLMSIGDAVEDFDPDVIYTTGEPGCITALAHFVPARVPFLAYVPIEGEPLIYGDWRSLLGTINWFTCSKYGQAIAKRDVGRDVDFVYHGVDHDIFKPDAEARAKTREELGWTDKFVVMTVAANVRRKQHPRLFEAIAILRDTYKQRDIILYDHTKPFNRHWLEGWHLPQVADAFGLHKEVVFNPFLAMGESVPDGAAGTGGNRGPSLADLYRSADLFVLPSQVEGFGLPTAEAMASGTPVLVTKYAAGWEVASPAGAGIPVYDWEICKNGTKYGNVRPLDIAKGILDLKRDPKRMERMSAAGIVRAQDYQWSVFQEYVIDAVEKSKEAGSLAQSEPSLPALAAPGGAVHQGAEVPAA